MMKHVFALGILFIVVVAVEGQYEDVRCKCVCLSPDSHSTNNTDNSITRQIYIEVFKEPSSCTCENVVPSDLTSLPEYCTRCECQWQRRNTTTIKVVVILIICVISLLVLYMLFLLCLDPLMSRRPKTYLEQRNEEVNLDTQSVTQIIPGVSESGRPRTGVISRVKHEVNRVKGEQQKWKGTVQEQRRNIYDRHTMLN